MIAGLRHPFQGFLRLVARACRASPGGEAGADRRLMRCRLRNSREKPAVFSLPVGRTERLPACTVRYSKAFPPHPSLRDTFPSRGRLGVPEIKRRLNATAPSRNTVSADSPAHALSFGISVQRSCERPLLPNVRFRLNCKNPPRFGTDFCFYGGI